jgi:peptidoglycan/xylan/chitin deacetylase (PgdA/CDA1 family)/SAM-dependent methyltransferase
MTIFERLVVEHSPILPGSAGRQHAVAIDASREVQGLMLPADAERVLIVANYGDTRLGTLELPVCDGTVPAAVLSDAIAAKYMWPILSRLLAPVYASLRIARRRNHAAVYREAVCLTTDAAEPEYLPEELHDRVGWTVFLQELFDRPDISDAGLYDEAWADPHRAAVRTVHDGEWIQVEATSEIPQLRGPAAGVLVQLTVGGAAVALIPMDVGRRGVRAHALRTRLIVAGNLELARAAVREGLLMATAADGSHWRDRLVRRAADAATLVAGRQSGHSGSGPGSEEALIRALRAGPASLVIGRRAGLPVGSTASRHAAFPATCAADLRAAALAAGELAVDLRSESPLAPVAYVPEAFLRPPPSGLATDSRSGPAPNAFGRHHFETIFAAADPWKYATAYEQTKYDQTMSLLPDERIERALEVGCAEGHFTARLAGRVGHLTATDISHTALVRAGARCGDCTNVAFERLDVVADALPPNQDLVVCSEMLYYVGDRRQLAVVIAKLRDSLKPGGYLLSAHANTTADGEAGTAFEWDVPFGAKTIGEVMGRVAGLSRICELRTALYRIFLFRRSTVQPARRFNPFARRRSAAAVITAEHGPLTPQVASHVSWHKSSGRGGPPPPVVTHRLPILMYHRIAAAGAATSAPYRVSPHDFEDQLRYLREAGFRSISLDEWRQAGERRRPIDGRAVLITFDDGFADFEEVAWPLLRQYGFGAIVFVVTDRVGGTNDWDAPLGERVPLMDWPALIRLEASGVEFGGHSASHQAMTGLSVADVVREATRCRTALLSRLRHPVPAFAYPFGDADRIVQHLVGACGYGFGLTCEPRRSRAEDASMALPRVEVRGTETLTDFIAKLTKD